MVSNCTNTSDPRSTTGGASLVRMRALLNFMHSDGGHCTFLRPTARVLLGYRRGSFRLAFVSGLVLVKARDPLLTAEGSDRADVGGAQDGKRRSKGRGDDR